MRHRCSRCIDRAGHAAGVCGEHGDGGATGLHAQHHPARQGPARPPAVHVRLRASTRMAHRMHRPKPPAAAPVPPPAASTPAIPAPVVLAVAAQPAPAPPVTHRYTAMLDRFYADFARQVKGRPEDGWTVHSNNDGLEVLMKQVLNACARRDMQHTTCCRSLAARSRPRWDARWRRSQLQHC